MKQAQQAAPASRLGVPSRWRLQRQCACGNHAAAGECDGCKRVALQRKPLLIGPADDALEQEADRVAAAVTGDSAARVSNRESPSVTRASAAIAGSDVGRDAPQIVHEVLRAPGQALDADTRAFFEPRFGHDFSAVRVHADAQAAESAHAVQALAYTAGHHVVFGAGRFAPASAPGRQLLGHELTHVVQQSGGALAGAATVQRKVILNKAEMPAKDRKAFVAARKWTSAGRASAVMDDMAAAADDFDFKDEAELESELHKRLSTVAHMEESQVSTEKVPGDKRSAFGYPFTGASALYGPRVNYAAREYWDPGVSDDYAVRKDKAKNAQLKALPRHQRCGVYGDPCDYRWKLSAKGRADPYHAIAYLFAPQPPHKRSLIHCDYLISLVNFLSLADAVGAAEFNKRVAAFGPEKILLTADAFTDLHKVAFERTATGAWKKDSAGNATAIWGLGSAQRVRPSSEADLVIGDHVVFFNHLAYDLINQNIGNAWRLENAVLVSKVKGKDVFLGHGSGYKTADDMRAKLAQEYNDVANKALGLVAKTKSPDKKTKAAAQSDLTAKFPNVKPVGADWRAQGVPGLLKDSACPKPLDQKLQPIKPSEVIGPKSPCDPTKMNEVERPIESAK